MLLRLPDFKDMVSYSDSPRQASASALGKSQTQHQLLVFLFGFFFVVLGGLGFF